MKKPYKLKLTKLEFLSSCDVPAQGDGAQALLLKRADDVFELRAKVAKTDDALGLVFGYAFSTSLDGGKTPHVDCQEDAIDPDFLKTVTEFIEAGGKTDVNHDFESDGKIVYAWPLLPEINAAMGIKSEKMGLAVAVKPSADTYKRFKSGELTGFSIAGTGIREPLEKAAGRVLKASLYTDIVDGHQHQICIWDNGEMYVQSATSEGAEMSHSHGIVRNADGAIEILLDSGHTHQIAEGQADVVIVQPETIVVVQARAPRKPSVTVTVDESQLARALASKSTQPTTPRSVDPQVKETAVDPKDQQIVDLTKRNERLDRIAKMSGAHKAHFDTLKDEAAEAFLAKSNADRDAEIAKALSDDPIEVSFDGVDYRKSAGAAVISLAKAAKANADLVAKQEIEKQATAHLGNTGGEDAMHQDVIRAIHAYTKADLEKRGKMLAWCDGVNAIAKGRQKAPGSDGAGDVNVPTDAYDALAKGLVAFCKAEKIEKVWTDGLSKFTATEQGAALKRAYDESRN